MTRVFVSYAAGPDLERARRLATDLRAAGVTVWMAPDSIAPGTPFAAAIDAGLEGSDCFLALLSPASLTKEWVKLEVAAAVDRAAQGKIRVLPVVLSPVAVPPLLSVFQQIDLTDYERGLAALGAAIGVPLHGLPLSGDQPAEAPGLRRPVVDEFAATVTGDLERGARRFGYLVQRTGGGLACVVEVALLRIGVAVWPDPSTTEGHILGQAERELRGNEQRVAVVLAVHRGPHTRMTPYRLLDAEAPNTFLMTWNDADGADALGACVDVIVRHLGGG
ncbi:toll/interleukin-1 receptor domain-containing protein [Nonomuraea sp. NPDC049421]|uniref:toll/interleukin-1 receptor domain-containing protein n=1 Tax=Nonomuraea sp. NPDC049421 TaxID=3155275 RepID=UPI003446F234